LIYLGFPGASLLTTDFARVSPEDIAAKRVGERTENGALVVGFVPYLADKSDFAQSRWFRVRSGIHIDPQMLRPLLTSHEALGFDLIPSESDGIYLNQVSKLIDEIRSGRFYQLNLLRYFSAKSDYPLNALDLFNLVMTRGGDYSAMLIDQGLRIVSCSPERFVSGAWHTEGQYILQTFPIKGSRESKVDAESNLVARELGNSTKDLAELSMIVDLMRNDLQRISQQGSVRVGRHAAILSAFEIVHLYSQISSTMKDDVRFADLFSALCPAGSITGAPKIEVMSAIQSYEQRRRDWFMGHCFMIDEATGTFDSSVMIRTLVDEAKGEWSYAAGSGIVIKSSPESELAEIGYKCRVVMKKKSGLR
jgi:anthranilate/para-aminobenzoate synthase component I